MDNTEITDTVFKPLRPDERRENTDLAFRSIVETERNARLAKTERLRQARLQTQPTVM